METQLLPPDIGSAWTWTKDDTTMYGGFHTFFKDYPSGMCAGRYRVRTNTDWWENSGATGAYGSNEGVPTGAFDGLPGSDFSGETFYSNNVAATMCSSTVACNIELILEVPCQIYLSRFGVGARADSLPDRVASSLTLYGSSDDGGMWTEVGSYSGEYGWAANETRFYTADSTLGPFSWFKFLVNNIESASTVPVNIRDLYLLAVNNDTQQYGSGCPQGEVGVGQNCYPAVSIPPSDIGSGDTWMKDDVETYAGMNTFTKQYPSGSAGVCPGDYRVSTSAPWAGDSGTTTIGPTEYPPSGAFDLTSGDMHNTWKTSIDLSSTMDAIYPVELLIETPCFVRLDQVTLVGPSDSMMAPRKGNIFGGGTPEEVFGMGGGGENWTLLASFDNLMETDWSSQGKMDFRVNGTFSKVKLEVLRITGAAMGPLALDEMVLYSLNQT
eukprot:Cvel_28299.t1-p1 / transcript=Cvel_28299.t1 / gene=Cvel_28299 / organism=Chromera_velia_CCMP2878 / gene_product=hypothetical protein / transcript_product=hypothetical protein / location=Cvel_scaffold3672:12715-14334(+) / protein_length=438 / sequence_SO=supercontig / SO=protein_coding / is_pseudo=false